MIYSGLREMTADRQFEALGYEKIHDNRRRIVYKFKRSKIIFKLKSKNVVVKGYEENIDLLIKAIDKKCEELRWL